MHGAGFPPATHQDAGKKSRFMLYPACMQSLEVNVLSKVDRGDHASGNITVRG